ncbi:hypothetical protein HanIR_Chr12g0594841 [Helianthus annuus]|nr:hypothetical protein HanIR_Chr12g0594841 [Helianthus annuus]
MCDCVKVGVILHKLFGWSKLFVQNYTYTIQTVCARPGKRVGSGWVMGQNNPIS